MRYVVVEEYKKDISIEEFESKEEAIIYMLFMWDFIKKLRKNYKQFYLLDSNNPDEEADNHLDGNVIYQLA